MLLKIHLKTKLPLSKIGAPYTLEERVKYALDKDHIQHCNTHYQSNPFDESRNREALHKAAQLQTNTRQGHVDVDGKEIKSNAPPTVNGFEFMKTPSPVPGVGVSPLMTWGEIEGTPFRLDGSDTPLPSSSAGVGAFQLQPVSERDRIGHKLAEKVGQGYRDRRGRSRPSAATMASPRSSSGTPSKTAGTLRYIYLEQYLQRSISFIVFIFSQSKNRPHVSCC